MKSAKQNIQIDADRLWNSLAAMAEIGATEKGGVCRLALTDVDKQGRDLFVLWCRQAGCQVRIDRMGNIFARREGRDPSLPPIVTGSHLDSQPTGGRFDGVYGVLAGLEVVRTLNDFGYVTEAPIEVAVWTNEEGSRFAPAMVASGVYSGAFDLDYGLSRTDMDGNTLGSELARIGYAGTCPVGSQRFGAFFEAHIEQGPILEASRKTIGVVTGAQAQRWYEVSLAGQEAHAGTTPMDLRHDALVGAGRAVLEVNRIALERAPRARATVGLLNVKPNSRNTVPGHVFFAVDLRHPDNEILSEMDSDLRSAIAAIANGAGLTAEVREIWHSPPVAFDAGCVAKVRECAELAGLEHMDIISGAGHDACYINRIAPTGMIFIPCEGGISHNEVESATKQDVAAGAQVLLLSMLSLADSG